MRESPAIPIFQTLLEKGAILKAYNPIACNETRKLFNTDHLFLCKTLEEAIEGVDGIVLVTSWKEFQQVPELLKKVNPFEVLIDGHRMLDNRLITHYEGIGL